MLAVVTLTPAKCKNGGKNWDNMSWGCATFSPVVHLYIISLTTPSATYPSSLTDSMIFWFRRSRVFCFLMHFFSPGCCGWQQRKYSWSESINPKKRSAQCAAGSRRSSKENLCVVSWHLVRTVVLILYTDVRLVFLFLNVCGWLYV